MNQEFVLTILEIGLYRGLGDEASQRGRRVCLGCHPNETCLPISGISSVPAERPSISGFRDRCRFGVDAEVSCSILSRGGVITDLWLAWSACIVNPPHLHIKATSYDRISTTNSASPYQLSTTSPHLFLPLLPRPTPARSKSIHEPPLQAASKSTHILRQPT